MRPSSSRLRALELPSRRNGLTAVESLVAIAVTAVAGAALLTSLSAAVRGSRELALTAIARGLTEQLLDEAAALPVPLGVVPAKPTGPRSGFVCIDHYDGLTETPPRDRAGRMLGVDGLAGGADRPAGLQADAGLLGRVTRSVSVERVARSGAGWTVTTGDTLYRRVTVRTAYADAGPPRPLAESTRIVGHLAPPL